MLGAGHRVIPYNIMNYIENLNYTKILFKDYDFLQHIVA
jgi:hypothetical protein